MSDFEFTGERLVEIPSPLQDEARGYESALQQYGFPESLDSDEDDIRILGPAKDSAPYEWAVEITLNERCFAVWLRDFPDLHAYLLRAAPMLAFLAQLSLGAGVLDGDSWRFSPACGLSAGNGASEAQQYNRTAKHQSEHAEQPEHCARFAQYGLPTKTGSNQERTGTET